MRKEITSQAISEEHLVKPLADLRSSIQNRWTITITAGGAVLGLGGSILFGEPLSQLARIAEGDQVESLGCCSAQSPQLLLHYLG